MAILDVNDVEVQLNENIWNCAFKAKTKRKIDAIRIIIDKQVYNKENHELLNNSYVCLKGYFFYSNGEDIPWESSCVFGESNITGTSKEWSFFGTGGCEWVVAVLTHTS